MTAVNPAVEGLAYGMYVFVGWDSYRCVKRDMDNHVTNPAQHVQRWVLVNAVLASLMTLALVNVYGLRLAFVIAAAVALLVGLVTLGVEAQRAPGTNWIAHTAMLAVVSLGASGLMLVAVLK